MTDFELYGEMGLKHILDPRGYDHILFIVALCAVYDLKEWKKVAWLVTAFTLGHSITLALSTMKLIYIKSETVEFLIPVTILITCFVNFVNKKEKFTSTKVKQKQSFQRYLLAVGFGLIHGLGFSNFLKSMLGKEPSIAVPLISFNIGLEVGQLVIVLSALIIGALAVYIGKVSFREWVLVISGMVAGIALTIIQQNWIF